MNQINLKGRTAIVTGGAQGFGLAIVKRFIASGANVIIWDNDEDCMSKIDLKNCLKFNIDITSFESINKGLDFSLKNSDKIDILVNNAGIAGPSFKTWEYPIKEWQKVIDIDLSGVFLRFFAFTPFSLFWNLFGSFLLFWICHISLFSDILFQQFVKFTYLKVLFSHLIYGTFDE